METFHSKTNTFSRNLTAFFNDKLKSFGLATSYAELMMLLKKKGDYSQKALAEDLSLAPSTITRFINKLEKKEYVKKVRKGREAFVRLTDSGQKVTSEMEAAYQAAADELTGVFGDKFVVTVGKLLEFGNGVLEEMEENKPD
jgi:MarR family transcriptional regulator, organic hydroperoxide resistance regulator